MKRRKRNYKAEYRRRIKRGLAEGLSRSQARGHPKAREMHVVPRRSSKLDEHRFQLGLRTLREGKSLKASARAIGVSPEWLRRQLDVTAVAKKVGRRWRIRDDAPRQMLIFSNGRRLMVTVPDLKTAGEVGGYLNAVKKLLWNNEPDYLEPFIGKSITDTSGKTHPFETDPNTLYRLSLTGTETFEQIYRIVV